MTYTPWQNETRALHRESGREGDEIDEEGGRRRGACQCMRGEEKEEGGREGGRDEERGGGVIALGPGQEGCK